MENRITIDTKKSLVKKQVCFSQLTDNEIDALTALLSEVQIVAGTTIVTEGEPVDSVYFIVEGTAEVRHVLIQDNHANIIPLATLNAGDAIGLNETGFYSLSGLRTATVVALTPMILLRLNMAAFHGLALSNHHINTVMRQYTTGLIKKLNSEK